jgi:hypothetical protein
MDDRRTRLAREVFPRACSCAMKGGILEIQLTERLHARVWPLGGAWEISAVTFDLGVALRIPLGQGEAPGFRPALDALRVWLRDNVGVHAAPSEHEIHLEGMVQAMSATMRKIREKAGNLISEMDDSPFSTDTWGKDVDVEEDGADEGGG